MPHTGKHISPTNTQHGKFSHPLFVLVLSYLLFVSSHPCPFYTTSLYTRIPNSPAATQHSSHFHSLFVFFLSYLPFVSSIPHAFYTTSYSKSPTRGSTAAHQVNKTATFSLDICLISAQSSSCAFFSLSFPLYTSSLFAVLYTGDIEAHQRHSTTASLSTIFFSLFLSSPCISPPGSPHFRPLFTYGLPFSHFLSADS